ncbi:hypothetical protein FGO68_gene694 [Halteria grandinella]|uniref:Uncharacterized protein n=1 Tax=Halteria grandinella TaxID=5974 RepID=A0A8J8T944_HALGN|nr:hypothetical protein FGO68_gene694 [Halteria grandinella]
MLKQNQRNLLNQWGLLVWRAIDYSNLRNKCNLLWQACAFKLHASLAQSTLAVTGRLEHDIRSHQPVSPGQNLNDNLRTRIRRTPCWTFARKDICRQLLVLTYSRAALLAKALKYFLPLSITSGSDQRRSCSFRSGCLREGAICFNNQESVYYSQFYSQYCQLLANPSLNIKKKLPSFRYIILAILFQFQKGKVSLYYSFSAVTDQTLLAVGQSLF